MKWQVGGTGDRYDRKKVLLICLTGEIATVLTLAVASWQGWASVQLLLVVGFLFGASRAFFAPANTALGPMLVPRPLLPRAIAWNSLAWQTASIAGPAAGGLLVAISPAHAYFTTFGLYLVAGLGVPDPQERQARGQSGLALGADEGGPGLCLAPEDRFRRHLPRPLRRAAGR